MAFANYLSSDQSWRKEGFEDEDLIPLYWVLGDVLTKLSKIILMGTYL